MLKVTADPNTYISALNLGGKPPQILELARSGRIELAVSNAIMTEMSRVLYNKFQWHREDVAEAVDLILGFAKYVHPDEKSMPWQPIQMTTVRWSARSRLNPGSLCPVIRTC